MSTTNTCPHCHHPRSFSLNTVTGESTFGCSCGVDRLNASLGLPPDPNAKLGPAQTRVAEYEPKRAEPQLTEQRLREIIREELERYRNPDRAFVADAHAQRAALAKPPISWPTSGAKP